MDQDPLKDPVQKNKKWLPFAIIGMVVVITAAVMVVVLIGLNQPKKQAEQQVQTPKNTTKEPITTHAEKAIMYAGNSVYDACNLLTLETVKKNVKDYQTLLDTIGTQQKPTDPLVIEHRYVDRDIARPLGKDAQPRLTSMVPGSTDLNAGSFSSPLDSNCWYGQGRGLSLGRGKTFVKLHVTQKPTPLSGELVTYLGKMTKQGTQDGFDIYIEQKADGAGFFTAVLVSTSKGIAVTLKTSTAELLRAIGPEITRTISKSATGPFDVIYPMPWSSLPNPCTLLTASDFEHFTGKPASATAEDSINLTEVGGHQMERSCARLEVDRLDGSPISASNVTIRLARDENAAKKYVEDIKKDDTDTTTTQPLKQKINVADAAYVKIATTAGKESYEFEMRIGAALLTFNVTSDNTVDASADIYAARMLPVAQSVAGKYIH